MEAQTTAEVQAPSAPSAPSAEDAEASLDSRAAALIEQITTEQKSAARETQAAQKDAPAKVEKAEAKPETPAEERTPEQIAEARRARIAQRDAEVAKLAEEERAKVAASRAKKQERAPDPAPVPPANSLAITDAASFFAAAEKLAIPPQDLAAWLTGQQDPAKVAESSAKRALTPVEQKLKELEEKQAQWEERRRQEAEQYQVAQLVERNHQLLAQHLDSVKVEAPLAAAFMAKAPAKFRSAVEAICDGLPPGFTAQDVIDQLEENLTDLQLSGSTAPAVAPASNAKSKPAAVKANVGNRLAAERATTVDEDGESGGDLEERARRLKAHLRAAG